MNKTIFINFSLLLLLGILAVHTGVRVVGAFVCCIGLAGCVGCLFAKIAKKRNG